MKFFLLIFKNISRNRVRSVFTALCTMVLVFVVTLVWSILTFLDNAMAQKDTGFKAIVTEKWQFPSQMPFSYASTLVEGAARADHPEDQKPLDSMTWQFYAGTTGELKDRNNDNSMFAFALEPIKLVTMMDELDTLPSGKKAEMQRIADEMDKKIDSIVIGRTRLKSLNKRVGETIKLTSFNYRGIDLEFKIVGIFPDGRYDLSAAMNREYLLRGLDKFKQDNQGRPHFLEEKTLGLVWLKVPDAAAFAQIDEQIENSPLYSSPAVKCETAASGISSFLDAYRDLIWGMRVLLAPAALITMALVISNAISISVRERRMEIAVLKVLGFGPTHIMGLVLGESLLLGTLAGVVSSWLTLFFINYVMGGIKFPIAFFAAFMISENAYWWGPVVGAVTALAGSLAPALSARSVKVSDVFSKVA